MGKKLVVLMFLIIIVLATPFGSIAADNNIYYTEAKLIDLSGSTGYIINFTGSYPGYGNMVLEYYNSTLHTLEIREEDILGRVDDSQSFTYTTTPTTEKFRVEIEIGGVNYYVSTTVYGHEYNGRMGNNATVIIQLNSNDNLIIKYNDTQVYSKQVSSGDTINIEFNIDIYVDGQAIGLNPPFSYIWKIEKTSGPPASPHDYYTFSRVYYNPKIYVDNKYVKTILSQPFTRTILYDGSRINIIDTSSNTEYSVAAGSIYYVNSTILLGIYYYLEPTTVTSTVTSTVTETVEHTQYYTLTKIVNHTVTRYIDSTYNNNWIIPGIIVFILLIILGLGLAASTGKHLR